MADHSSLVVVPFFTSAVDCDATDATNAFMGNESLASQGGIRSLPTWFSQFLEEAGLLFAI